MPRAVWNGAVLAESEGTQQVEGNDYFPPSSLNRDYFRDSDTTTQCGWKGTAHYYTIEVDGRSNPDSAWYYPNPKPEAAHIANYVAFWKGVDIIH